MKSALLEGVASALYYNPQLTLQWAEANNATQVRVPLAEVISSLAFFCVLVFPWKSTLMACEGHVAFTLTVVRRCDLIVFSVSTSVFPDTAQVVWGFVTTLLAPPLVLGNCDSRDIVLLLSCFRRAQGMLTQLFVCMEAGVFDTNLSKKIIALGLTSLLSLPSTSLPPAVTQVLPHAFGAVVNVRARELEACCACSPCDECVLVVCGSCRSRPF